MLPELRDNTWDHYNQDFLGWVEKNKIKGSSLFSSSTDIFFVSRRSLEEYFSDRHRTRQIIQTVCRCQLTIDLDEFLRKWTCVFAILLYIGKGSAIQKFIDQGLYDSRHPFEVKPPDFPYAAAGEEFWPRYRENQWLFFPLELQKNNFKLRVPEHRVLPFIEKQEIGGGGSSKVFAIKVHHDYEELSSSEQSRQSHQTSDKTYVLKIYHSHEAQEHIETEIEAFVRIGSSEAIVTCYGGLKQESQQGPAFALILEYADCGTLEDFFQNDSPPSTQKDMIAFWENLNRIALALYDVHVVHIPALQKRKGEEVWNGWHQDVKPKNILLFGDQAAPSKAHFKLADLGLSHFRRNSDANSRLDVETYGTTEYGAPEASRATEAVDFKRIFVDQSTDIWSLGCIFSEALVWSIRGKGGLLQYRLLRKNETERIHEHRNHGSFHNEVEMLDSVTDTHQALLRDRRQWDNITPRMIELTEEMLATRPDTRPTAKQVEWRTGRALRPSLPKSPHSEPTPSDGTLSPPLSALHPQHRAATLSARSEPLGAMEIENLRMDATKQSFKNLTHPDSPDQAEHSSPSRSMARLADSSDRAPRASTDPNAPGEATNQKESEYKSIETLHARVGTALQTHSVDERQSHLPHISIQEALDWATAKQHRKALPDDWPLKSLKDRDCVFLIEDGHRIRPYWDKVRGVCHALAYATKKYDKNGIDAYRMVDMGKIHSRTSRDLLSRLPEAPDFLSGDVDINNCLTQILGDYGGQLSSRRGGILSSSRRPKALIVYVLTTGEWDGNGNAETPIATLIERLNKENCPQKQVGIQFIHFGDSEEGWKRLVHLDDHLDLSRDIVDAERSNGNFWKMLIGSINDRFDANGKKVHNDHPSMSR